MSEDYILEARGLTKQFRGFYAVKDVDLRVRRHGIHALIGPNGAGKTTCFNLLTTFLRPTAGTITYNGRRIEASDPASVAGGERATGECPAGLSLDEQPQVRCLFFRVLP